MSDFSDFFFRFCSDLAAFSDFFFHRFFFDDLLNIRLAPPKKNPRFPTGPPLSFSIKNKKKIGKKSDFRCRPPKNGFKILNLHLKKQVLKKIPFF